MLPTAGYLKQFCFVCPSKLLAGAWIQFCLLAVLMQDSAYGNVSAVGLYKGNLIKRWVVQSHHYFPEKKCFSVITLRLRWEVKACHLFMLVENIANYSKPNPAFCLFASTCHWPQQNLYESIPGQTLTFTNTAFKWLFLRWAVLVHFPLWFNIKEVPAEFFACENFRILWKANFKV